MSDGEPEDAEEPQEPEDEMTVLEAKLAELEKELLDKEGRGTRPKQYDSEPLD